MAVLESSMEDEKSHKYSPNSKKTTLLLAQDLSYARSLASNEEKVRRRSLKYLKKYLEQRSKVSPLTDDNFKVLWKGLFYSMWMSDKPLVQEECAENISHLIHCLQFDEAMQFFKFGMVTLQNEWIGIDQLRLDKFLMFVRRLLRQALFVLKKTNFKKLPNEVFAGILEGTILSTTKYVPLGLFMHFTEIYLEELAKVADGKLQSSRAIDLLRPYISKLAFADDNRIIKWINKFIFTHLMRQHKLGLEYEEKYRVWKTQGFVGSINQIQKVIVVETEPEQDSDNERNISRQNKPLDPRAGRVNVELPQIPFSAKEISQALLIPKSHPRTTKATRNHLTIWSEKFLQLHNGIYPLGSKMLESKKRKHSDIIDTNITKAAKRLIKFEQKLLAKESKGKKRKRDTLEHEDEEPDVPIIKKKKASRLEESSKNIINAFEENGTVMSKVRKHKSHHSSPDSKFSSDSKKKIKKKKSFELKQSEMRGAKNKLKKKKLKRHADTSTSVDDYNFCFERNSGIWVVTPEFGGKNEKEKYAPPVGRKDSAVKDTDCGGYGIFIPSKKFVNKLKKTKSEEEVEQVLSNLRGKSRTSLSNLSTKVQIEERTPMKLHLKAGSPKKVVINTRLNISQEIDDHILQVKSSPQIPWDSSKKPGKPLLKTPIKASPINPFYKLRRF